MRWLLVVVVTMAGCVSGGEPARAKRWPHHRETHDQQIAQLMERVDKLEKELAETRAYIARLRVVKPAAPPPPPDAGTLPASGGATP